MRGANPAAGVADFDAFRQRVGKVHRTASNRPITAKRNRQNVRIACGGVLRLALPVSSVADLSPADRCGRCWRYMEREATP